jgi:tripartite-type tricarboxylate transporter receptor subunit TctC
MSYAHGRIGRRGLIGAASALAALGVAPGAVAQQEAWPTRSVRLVVPWAPGGASDLLGRLVARKLSESLGQQVVVDNRAGAGGTVGMQNVARSAPDGYSLVQGTSSTIGLTPALMNPEPFDGTKDFAPIAFVADDTNGLFISAAIPARTAEEFIAWIKAQPSPVPYASSGVGTPGHVGIEMFGRTRGLNLNHIPYRGAGPALTDVAAGTVAMIFTGAAGGKALADAGRVRLLAVTGRARQPSLPDVPTVRELGLEAMDVPVWHGYFAPAGTPRPVLQRLHVALVALLRDSEFLASLSQQLMTPFPVDQRLEDAQAFVDGSIGRMREMVRATGIRIEG